MTVHAITPALAHVTSEANLLVTNVRAEGENTYRSVFVIDGTHPYLYENPAIANHVSGTTFIDMGRQLLKAISHIYYGNPMDSRFVLQGIDIQFARWARLETPIEVVVTLSAASESRRADGPRTWDATLEWSQEGHSIAKARSSFTTLTAELEHKLMQRQYRQLSGGAAVVA